MDKKLISWVLLGCMLLGVITPAAPAYAQEPAEQAIVSDALESDDSVPEDVMEGEAPLTFETDIPFEDEEETEIPSEEDIEAPDIVLEDIEEETAMEPEETEAGIEEDVPEAVETEEEKLGDGHFYDDYKGDIGYLGDGCVTFETKPADIDDVGDAYLYASPTEDKKNSVYLGFKTLQDPTYYNETYYGDQFEKEYLKANKLDLHQAEHA
ncbi:MAG: hypothetical protein K6F34_01010, partial [Lachnospiraceae bacterium]|nr:hypothetical protein [Lachnospiraceae bacterium]